MPDITSEQRQANGALQLDMFDDSDGLTTILDVIAWGAGQVLEHHEPALRAAVCTCAAQSQGEATRWSRPAPGGLHSRCRHRRALEL